MVMTSLKPLDEVTGGNMFALPHHLTFDPWVQAWGEARIGVSDTAGIKGYFWNSIKMVVPAVLISTLLGALNGYVLTKWRFPGHKLVFGMMLFACFIPFQSVIIPMAVILGELGRIGNQLSDLTGMSFGFGNPTVNLVIVHVIYGLGFTTLFFRNYYEAFPTELVKAAMIDGASFFQIFRRILAAEFRADFHRDRDLPVHQYLERLPVRVDLRGGRPVADDGRAQQSRQHFDRDCRVQRQHGGGDHRRRSHSPGLHCRRPVLRARPDGRRRERLIAWAFLEISGLRKRFGALEILKGIDLTLDKGGFLVLVGPSGCGKSTLLNTIAGLESISSGEIRIEGDRINDLHPSKRDIAMVFQSYALYPNMSVAQNIAFGMEMRGVPKPQRDKAVADVAKTLKIEHLLSRRPSQLSGGQRQRVAMGRALVRQPRVFLFDEPLSNLDAKLRVDMRVEIKRLHQQTGATIVYVTHDQIEAMTLATRIAVLKDGELQQVGTPS